MGPLWSDDSSTPHYSHYFVGERAECVYSTVVRTTCIDITVLHYIIHFGFIILDSDRWPCSNEGLWETISEDALLHVQAIYPLVNSCIINFIVDSNFYFFSSV